MEAVAVGVVAAICYRHRDSQRAAGFQNVLDAERALFNLENRAADTRGAATANLVRLYKALGGGWDPDKAAKPDPKKLDEQPDAKIRKPCQILKPLPSNVRSAAAKPVAAASIRNHPRASPPLPVSADWRTTSVPVRPRSVTPLVIAICGPSVWVASWTSSVCPARVSASSCAA